MRPTVSAETARAWLEEQLGELSQFRNANIRDAQFKQWRQNTLTVVQRIWPGVTTKSRRFRRVPFTPPSSLADTKQIREAFERGCAEAGILLRQWITEIEQHGVRPEESESPMAAGAELDAGTATIDLDAPARPGREAHVEPVRTLDLGAVMGGREPTQQGDANRPAANRKSRPGRNPGVIPQSPDPETVSKAEAPMPSLSIVPPPPPLGPAPVEASAPRDDRPRARAAKKKNGARLKDMLGLGDFTAASVPPSPRDTAPTSSPVSHATGPVAHAAAPEALFDPEVLAEPDLALLRVIGAEPVEPEVAPSPDEPAIVPAPPPVLELLPLPLPVPSSIPAPEVLPLPTSSPAPDAAGTAAIALIATELANIDLPAAERESLQRSLIELALHLESGACTWDEVRDVIGRTLAHPELARRALPAIVPFLHRAR